MQIIYLPFLAVIAITAKASVITNSIEFSNSPPISTYSLTVYQDSGSLDYTSIYFNRTQLSLTSEGANLDEGSDWYLVSYGTAFTRETISNNSFTPFVTFLSSPVFHTISIPIGQFYLGVVTGVGFNGDTPNRNVFGWVRLNNTGSDLQIISSATAYGADGILIGTSTAVPESSLTSIFIIFFLAVALLFRLSSRTRRCS